MAACAQVLGTTELLEAILLQCETKDIVISQRVSKTFKATIDSSIRLQRALFFEPFAASNTNLQRALFLKTVTASNTDQQHEPRINELLLQKLGGKVDDIFLNSSAWLADLNDGRLVNDNMILTGDKGYVLCVMAERAREVFGRQEASWRRIFFTQPPCWVRIRQPGDIEPIDMKNPRAGDLAAEVEEAALEPWSYFQGPGYKFYSSRL